MANLKNIEPSEISFTDLPATRKKFLFFKRDMQKLFDKYQDSSDIQKRRFLIAKKDDKKISISIESDGTIKGTKIIVSGEEIKNLQDFHFSFYKPRGEEDKVLAGNPISCSYSKITETEDGFKHSDTFYLSKSEMEVNGMDMNKELKDLLDSYFDEEVSFAPEEFELEKAELSDKALNAIKGALKLISKYKADFPDDLKGAVGVLAKYASYGYGYPAKKKEEVKKEEDKKVGDKDVEDKDVEKSGKALSKDTVGKVKSVIKAFNELQNVVKALNDLLPEGDQIKLKKSDATEGKDADKEFKNALDEVSDIAKRLEKKLEEKDQTIEKLGKDLEEKDKGISELSKRLETLEKDKGIKKTIEGQDDGGDDENKPKKKWSSFGV